jgi:hypothetical protein
VKTRLAIVSLTGLLGWAAFAGPAAAAPPGAGLGTLTANCGGQDVTVTVPGDGASFWIGDQHYALLSIDATSGPGTFHKDYGNKTGLQGTQINCTGSFVEDGELVMFDVTAVAVP